jgi:hypothetical protein
MSEIEYFVWGPPRFIDGCPIHEAQYKIKKGDPLYESLADLGRVSKPLREENCDDGGDAA